MTSSGPNQYPRDVGVESSMSLGVTKTFVPATAYPVKTGDEGPGHRLNISVVFTSVESTLTALREAGKLADSLGARITLLVPQIVPHPLPLESPPVLMEFNEKRFRVMASQGPVETRVHIHLCRDRFQTLKSVLGPGSIVVLSGPARRWWATRDQWLAKKLQRAGFEVIFKKTG